MNAADEPLSDSSGDVLVQLAEDRFEGREAFAQLVRAAFFAAAREGWKQITVADVDFADWPLGERQTIELLDEWVRGGGRWTMVAKGCDQIVRRHPRFVSWRSRWDHLVTCRASPRSGEEMPSMLLTPRWVLHRIDPVRCVGVATFDPARRVLAQELLQEWVLRRSRPGFPSTTLGL